MSVDQKKIDLSRLMDAERKPVMRSALYSRFVRWARLGLPLIALIIAAVALTWNERRAPIKTIEQSGTAAGQSGAMRNELLNPRFANTDDQGRPYTLTAARAFQNEDDKNIMLLESPAGDLMIDTDRWAALKARRGTFDQAARMLSLQDDVTLFYAGGYEVKTSALMLNLAAGTAKGDSPVNGVGPDIALQAAGINARAEGGVLILNGPARVILNLDRDAGGIF